MRNSKEFYTQDGYTRDFILAFLISKSNSKSQSMEHDDVAHITKKGREHKMSRATRTERSRFPSKSRHTHRQLTAN